MWEDLLNPSLKSICTVKYRRSCYISKQELLNKLLMTNAIEAGAICVTQRYFMPRPHLSVFEREQTCFAPDTAIAHTTTEKTITDNGTICKRSLEWSDLKMMLFWKRCFLVWMKKTMLSENGDNHQNRHNQATDHTTVRIEHGGEATVWLLSSLLSMCVKDTKAFSKRIRRCSVDGGKRYKNDKFGGKSFWKRSKTAPFSFENGLVWTGP